MMTPQQRIKMDALVRAVSKARAWTEHWEEDRRAGLPPTETSLRNLLKDLEAVLAMPEVAA